ncbi:hypothetical protein ACN47E_000289 [Coniothyrium glycines]
MEVLSRKHPHSPTQDSHTSPKCVRTRENAMELVKFLIMSDTHGADLPAMLPECDVLLHCGDFTEDGSPRSISETLGALRKIKAELKLVIAGNHEISLDQRYYQGEGGSLADVQSSQDMVKKGNHGITFLSEGTYTFTLKSGATFSIYASPYTPAYGSSAFQYPSGEDRFNPVSITPSWAKNVGTTNSIIPQDTDIIITHGPPKYILDTTADGRSAGCEHLRRAVERVKPKLLCFGHVHAGYGAQRIEYGEHAGSTADSDTILPLAKEWVGKNQAKKKGFASLPPGSKEDFSRGNQTMCVNAAMESEKGILENAPWLVELDLDVLDIAE